MIPLAAPNFFRNLPHDLQPLAGVRHPAVRAGGGDAQCVLQRDWDPAASAEADAATAAASAQHV